MEDLLKKIYSSFEDNNITYCILRRYDLSDGDVDIMLFQEDIEKLELIMNSYNAVKVDSILYKPHIQYHIPYVVDRAIKYFIFDCVFDFVVGKNMNKINITLNKNDFLLTLKKTEEGYFVPSYEYLTIFLAIHIFIENNSSINDKRFKELGDYFSKSNQSTLENVVSHVFINGNALPKFNIDSMESIFKSIKVSNNKVKFSILKIKSYLMKKIFIRNGVVIAFVGVDGTGKSTLSDGVCDILNAITHEVAESVYLGDKKLSDKVEKLKGKYRNRINKASLLLKIYKLTSLLVYFLKRFSLSYVYYFKSKKKHILSDRFILDRLIPSPNTKRISVLHIKALKLVKKLIKLPDIIYFLDGDAKIISDRKLEYSYHLTLSGMEFQREVLGRSNIKYKVLNTTENSINKIQEEVLIDICNAKRDRLFNV